MRAEGKGEVRMNIAPMPAEARAKVHYHDKIEHHAAVRTGDQIFIPADVPHAPFNDSGAACTWIVVHASGSDQAGIVLLPELDLVLAGWGARSQLSLETVRSPSLQNAPLDAAWPKLNQRGYFTNAIAHPKHRI